MKVEQQVVSLEFAKGLKELGVKQESLFWWVFWDDTVHKSVVAPTAWVLGNNLHRDCESISAFTVAELGDVLKDYDCDLPWYANGSWWWYQLDGSEWETKTEADARADLLHHLIRNNAPKV